jgi:hypothetical protein
MPQIVGKTRPGHFTTMSCFCRGRHDSVDCLSLPDEAHSMKLFDLAGAEPDRRFSPYCWRTKLALAHKGLTTETVPWRFFEKDAIAMSGQGRVPASLPDRSCFCGSPHACPPASSRSAMSRATNSDRRNAPAKPTSRARSRKPFRPSLFQIDIESRQNSARCFRPLAFAATVYTPHKTAMRHCPDMAEKRIKTAQVNLRIKPELKTAAEKAAGDDHRSLTSLIEKLLSDHLRKHGYLAK